MLVGRSHDQRGAEVAAARAVGDRRDVADAGNTAQWLPIEDSFERQLVERLVAQGRSFIKGLRYNLRRDQCVATATLTDMGHPGPLLFIAPPALDGPRSQMACVN